MKEIEIMKKLASHNHTVQLVGTYTHRQFLGLLLYPVAVCDLHAFFDDVEAWTSLQTEHTTREARMEALDGYRKDRLVALGYDFPGANAQQFATPIYSKIGCLISAISYLHDEKIRHRDLKPQNILLSESKIWLSDFGSATEFYAHSHSVSDNDRGTPRYRSPEVGQTA
jgi:serine/threonine protein kinase